MKKIITILGSVREARAGKRIADWVNEYTNSFEGGIEFEFIDLKEINLPFMDEPVSPMASDNYVHEHTRAWSKTVSEGDGFLFITPEYNHGYPPALKNALDFLYKEWQGKPVGFVGYGGGGARSSIDQLRQVVGVMGLKPLEEQVGIKKIWDAFDDKGIVKPDHVHGSLGELVDSLVSEIEKG